MTALLVTGMSGVGKSTVLAELAARGVATVDTDDAGWLHVVDGEPLWRADRIDALLDAPRSGPLVVQGTVANQSAWYPRFAAVVLLSAPVPVMIERLRTRSGNDFGKRPGELERILADRDEIEPLLRAGATHELDTTVPVAATADALLAIAAAVAHAAPDGRATDR